MTSVESARSGPPFTRGMLDRAAHRRTDAAWLSEAWSRARVVVVDDGHVLVDPGNPPELVLIDSAEAPQGERFFLGEEPGGTVYFAVAADVLPMPGTRRVDLRQVGHLLPDLPAGLFVTAVALANWHSRHPFSPLSGKLTTPAQGGWVRTTEDGTETLWPRTDPAVIMLVHDDVAGPEGRCLLGSSTRWVNVSGIRRYSTLAGFVEPGESAEMAVAREVLEEVGVRVGDVRYAASQPWPFPGSLMLGFHATAPVGAQVQVDNEEIVEARWFTRTEIAAVLEGRSRDFGLPFPASIAHYLVTSWLG
ncbi:NAD(+) diphosphatase [Dactylosporangium roseum]|uniref:NAD(+) diphosphatase n=1 Tax=Dactylosporangium roseum TaxID=47989 RepID=A0ABY5Z9I5_9ACTN|nr:NAD(+) diphosphatase [Dactylosporangium roseum]UWZ37650.1 NAD(+) diphosphatase [Dactylosporangium roseum]